MRPRCNFHTSYRTQRRTGTLRVKGVRPVRNVLSSFVHDLPLKPYLSSEEQDLMEKWVALVARDKAGNAAQIPIGAKVRLHGTLTAPWELDGLDLVRSGRERVDNIPHVGDYVEVRRRISNVWAVLVERIRRR